MFLDVIQKFLTHFSKAGINLASHHKLIGVDKGLLSRGKKWTLGIGYRGRRSKLMSYSNQRNRFVTVCHYQVTRTNSLAFFMIACNIPVNYSISRTCLPLQTRYTIVR